MVRRLFVGVGVLDQVSAEVAMSTNSAMIRNFDFNDRYTVPRIDLSSTRHASPKDLSGSF